jgi:hypothetical protein
MQSLDTEPAINERLVDSPFGPSRLTHLGPIVERPSQRAMEVSKKRTIAKMVDASIRLILLAGFAGLIGVLCYIAYVRLSEDKLLDMVVSLEGSSDTAVSPAGAMGRYQIEPATAQQYGADPGQLFNPMYEREVARKIIRDLFDRYSGNTAEILAAYNAGPGRADRFRMAGDDFSVLPYETQKYLQRGLR